MRLDRCASAVLAVLLLGSTAWAQETEPSQCIEVIKTYPEGLDPSDEFGRAVAIGNNYMAVGMWKADQQGVSSGVVLVYNATTGEELHRLLPDDGGSGFSFGWSVAIANNVVYVGAIGADTTDEGGGVRSGAVYAFDAVSGAQLARYLPSNPVFTGDFGYSLSVQGDYLVVGDRLDDETANSAGAAYLIDLQTGIQAAKYLPSDGEESDHFGSSVGIRGNTVVVGAPSKDEYGRLSGAAYVFDRDTGVQLFRLDAGVLDAFDYFGESVAVGDSSVYVGARGDDDSGSGAGAVYVFNNQSGAFLQKLASSDIRNGDSFGRSLAITGNTLVVGANGDDDNGSASGSVYIFDTATNNETTKLIASDGASFDYFGWSVSADETWLAVGALASFDANAPGLAYSFSLQTESQLSRVSPSPIGWGAHGDLFGSAVDLLGDTMLIGSLGDQGFSYAVNGSAYLLDRSTGDIRARLYDDQFDTYIEMGSAVALNSTHAFVGAPGGYDFVSNSYTGVVFVYDAEDGSFEGEIVPEDAQDFDRFGEALDANEIMLVIGAPGENDPFGPDEEATAGAAYVFDVVGGSIVAKLVAPDAALRDGFGSSVALHGGYIFVGAPFDDDNGIDSGSVYVFDATTYAFVRKITAHDGNASDTFGLAVSAGPVVGHAEGVLVVGAPNMVSFATSDQAVYTYDIQTGALLNKYMDNARGYGLNVASGEGFACVGTHAGGVRVIDLVLREERGYLPSISENPNHVFPVLGGVTSAVAADGDSVLVGAVFDASRGLNAGAACLFPTVTPYLGDNLPDIRQWGALQARNYAQPGERMSIAWEERRENHVADEPYVSRLYLSADFSLDESDTLLLEVDRSSGVGSSFSSVEAEVQIPGDTAGWYTLILVVNADRRVCERNYENNSRFSSIRIDPPDLEPTVITGPVRAAIGGTFRIEWSVRNSSGPVGSWPIALDRWHDYLYLSEDGVLDPDDDVLLRVPADWDDVGPDGYSMAVDVVAPEGEYGDFYLLVNVDDSDRLNEGDGEDNNVAVSTRTISLVPPQELVVAGFMAPSEAVAGTNILLKWDVLNNGTGAVSGSWIDRVYLSADQVVGDDDILLDEFGYSGGAESGEVVNREVSETVPGRVGPQYLLVVVDAANDVDEGPGEQNNVLAMPFEVLLPPIPDLVVSTIMTPSSGVQSGTDTSVSFQVENVGTGATSVPTWSDEVFLSFDDVLDSGDVRIGTQPNPLYLPAGQGYSQNVEFTLPNDTAGPFWIIARTDRANKVAESDEANNTHAEGPFTIELETQPDLRVSDVAVQSIGSSGEPVTVSWVETNSTELPGTGAPTDSGSWRARVFLSENRELSVSPGDIPLGTVSAGTGSVMDGGESVPVSREITLPEFLAGQYYVKVATDWDDVVSEFGFEGNNVGVTAEDGLIDIRLTPPVDLVPSSVGFSGAALPGHVLEISYGASNLGSPPQGPISWSDAIYLSSDSELNPAEDVRLVRVNRSATPSGIEPYTSTVSPRLPDSLAPGEYFLYSRLDDQDRVFEGVVGESNNERRAQAVVVVEDRYADLDPTIRVSSRSVYAPGGAIDIEWEVANAGDARTPVGEWLDGLYLSTDPVLGSGDALLASQDRSGILLPTESYARDISIPLPYEQPGTYYLIVHVDRTGIVYESESGDQNNTAVVEIEISDEASDLVVMAVHSPEGGGVSGQSLEVSWDVANRGIANTNRTTWLDRVEVVAVSEPERVIVSANVARQGSLSPDDSYSSTAFLPITIDVQEPLIARVTCDVQDRVFEQNEGNNTGMSSSIDVELPDADGDGRPDIADLAVQQVLGEETVEQGSTATVSWIVRNIGDGASSAGQWRDRIVMSPSGARGSADVELGIVSRAGGLGADAAYSESFDAVIPQGTPPGEYRLRVETDIDGAVFENGELANNSAPSDSVLTIEEYRAPNLVAVSVAGESQADMGQLLEVSWAVRNDGSGPPRTEEWTDAVWLSRDQFLGSTDVRLGRSERSGGLDVGQGYEQSSSFRIPAGLSGPYFLLVQVDSGSRVDEDDAEDDNVVASSSVVNVVVPDPGDLVVVAGSVATDSAATLGEPITVSWSVANAPDATASVEGSWEDSVFLSTDDTWDINDVLVGRLTSATTDPLEPGGMLEASLTASMPGVAPGLYHVIVRCDSRNLVPETDDGNNDTSSIGQLESDAPSLVLGTVATRVYESADEQYYKVFVPAGEVVRISFDYDNTRVYSELFVKAGDIPSRGDFDYVSRSIGTLREAITIPSDVDTVYYVLASVTGSSTPTTGHTLAEVLPFQLEEVTPSAPGAGVVTIAARGSRLDEVTGVVARTRDGRSAIVPVEWASNVVELRAVFDLTGLEGTELDLVVQSEAGSFVLENAFGVVPVQNGPVVVDVQSPSAVRPGGAINGLVTITNLGNIDASSIAFLIDVPRASVSSGSIGTGADAIEMQTGRQPGRMGVFEHFEGLLPGGRHVFPYTLEVSPSAPEQFSIITSARIPDPMSVVRRYIMLYYDSAMLDFRSTGFLIKTPEITYSSLDMPVEMFIGVTDILKPHFAAAFVDAIPEAVAVARLRDRFVGSGGTRMLRNDVVSRPPRFCSTPQWLDYAGRGIVCSAVGVVGGAGGGGVSAFVCNWIGGPFLAGRCAIAGAAVVGAVTGVGCSYLMDYLFEQHDRECCQNPCSDGCDRYAGNLCLEREQEEEDLEDECACEDRFLDTDGDGCIDLAFICADNWSVWGYDFVEPTEEDINACPPEAWAVAVSERDCVQVPRARDPNEIVGPAGVGESRWVPAGEPLQYRVYFENLPEATAPASRVVVTLPLDPELSAGSVRMLGIGFGETDLVLPGTGIGIAEAVPASSPQGTPLLVDIIAGVDAAVSPPEVFWVLRAVDTATGAPPLDPFDGFLPPNDPETGSGEGYIDFVVRPGFDAVTGDTVELQAEIVFDDEEPLRTNIVTNTLDADPPVSTLRSLPAATLNPLIPLEYEGTDAMGSGVAGVQVQVSVDDGPFATVTPATLDTALVYEGEAGRVYEFVTQAVDRAGNTEPIEKAPRATVVVPAVSLAVESDTGMIGDSVTLVRTPTIEIVSIPFSAIPIMIEGPESVGGTVFTDAVGRGRYTVPGANALSEGQYTVSTDNGGVVLDQSLVIAPAAELIAWASVADHDVVGDVGIPISEDGTTVEPRASGVTRLELLFNESIASDTFVSQAITVESAVEGGGVVALGAAMVSATLEQFGTVGVIEFDAALPDNACYCVSVDGLQDAGGNSVDGMTRVRFTTLRGDANGDRRVNGADVSYTRATRQAVSGDYIDTNIMAQVRSDLTLDGRVNGADVSFARALNGADARFLADPCQSIGAGDEPGRDRTQEERTHTEMAGLAGLMGGASSPEGPTREQDDRSDQGRDDQSPEVEEGSSWQTIDAHFAGEGRTLRLEPGSFVVGSSTETSDALSALLEQGVDPLAIRPLGHRDWLLVELGESVRAKTVRQAVAEAGLYTAPVLRDDRGDLLIATDSVIVRFGDSGGDVERQIQLRDLFGDSLTRIETDRLPADTMVLSFGTDRGEFSVNAANRLAREQAVQYAEPDFVMIVRRVDGPQSVQTEHVEPRRLNGLSQSAGPRSVGVVVLDDGVSGEARLSAGETVYGQLDHHGRWEGGRDRFGQILYDGITSGGVGTDTLASVRSVATLGEAGGAITQLSAMVRGYSVAAAMRPRMLVTSVSIGFRSRVLASVEADLLRSGVVVVRPVSQDEQTHEGAAESLLLTPLNVCPADDAATDQGASDRASRAVAQIGQLAAWALELSQTSPNQLERAAEATQDLVQSPDGGPLQTLRNPCDYSQRVRTATERLAVDLNRDGLVTQADVVEFSGRFGKGDLELDLDGNGLLDKADFEEFVRVFGLHRNN